MLVAGLVAWRAIERGSAARALLELAPLEPGPAREDDVGPGPRPFDAFHPEREKAVTPAFGGKVTVHLENLPRLNTMIENSTTARNMLHELHEFLVRQDFESWEIRPALCTGWEVEDTLVLAGGRGAGNANVVYGKVTDDGDAWRVVPASPAHALAGERRVPKAEVESVERASVYTFHLRDDVRWHDGEAFDADDVLFTWRAYHNPAVRCDSVRATYERIVHAEAPDPSTVRFFFREQHFRSLPALVDFCILPRHVYDPTDPAHPRHDPGASPEQIAREINENIHNTTHWIGLGPYRVTGYGEQGVEAERFDGYFDPENGGYLDRIHWRTFSGDAAAFQALLNGELDFTARLSSEQLFGPATQAPEFTERYYKGTFYLPMFNFTPWNMRRPLLRDLRVRKALAHAINTRHYLDTVGHGLGQLVTGDQFYYGPAYDHDVERLEFDLAKAADLFAEAGWYDRDGDGLIDKDGIPFEFELLTQHGNTAAEMFAQMAQEDLAKIGVRMTVTGLEWASYLERMYDRDFDAGGLAWVMPIPENDPVQLWHSSGAPVGVRGSNHPGVADPHVDELIAAGGRELDPEKRWAIWRELHRYLYEEVQPYLFREMSPRKFAMNKALRGVQTFEVVPGYSIRRWFYPAGTPGTRPAR